MNTKYQSRHRTYVKNLQDKEYRDLLVEESLRSRLAMQIRTLRTSRALTQEQLANKIDTKQEAVSRLENPDYGKYSIDTLTKLASAFDVALEVAFVPFSNLINRLVFHRAEGLDACSYTTDVELNVLIQDSATIITDADFLHKSHPRKDVSIQYVGSGNG